MSLCRSCDAEILWAKTAEGRSMPLDPDVSDRGNVALIVDTEPGARRATTDPSRGVATVLTGDELVNARFAGAPLFMPHHATCPHASRHRRRP